MSILAGLLLAMSFGLGYGHSDFALWDTQESYYLQQQYITPEFNVEARLGLLYIGGGVSVPTVHKEGEKRISGSFKPMQASFPFGFGIRSEHFEVGYSYSCNHPIMTYLTDYSKVKSRAEGAYWKVFIKVQGEFKPFEGL